MATRYLVYEDGGLWLDGTKKRRVPLKLIEQISGYYERKIPKTVYGWLTTDSNFIEDTKAMLERGLIQPK